jgi:transposase-like protein
MKIDFYNPWVISIVSGLIIFLLLSFPISWFLSWYFSPKRKLFPKEIVEQFQEHIEGQRCPNCASEKILSESVDDVDQDGVGGYIQTNWKCKKCKHTWTTY